MAAPATAAAALQMVCPALYVQGAAVYQPWLDLVDSQIAASDGTAGWNGQRVMAVAYLAAHQWSLVGSPLSATAAQVTGIISGESADNPVTQKGLSRSYAVPASNSPEEAELLTTRYGQQFVSLRRRCAAFGPGIANLSTATSRRR